MANKIVGTPGDDVLKGTKGKDIIKGKGGNDIIIGKKGGDVLKGGKGDDELKGGKGRDDLKGGKGDDLVFGGKGSDDHWGGPGADIFKFKSGDGFLNEVTLFSDDIVFDYQDGIDMFDIPGPGTVAVNLLGLINAEDPVAGNGTLVFYGVAGVGTGELFVTDPGGAALDTGDFF